MKSPLELARGWYTVDEIEKQLIGITVTAEWLVEQYRLAMAKGIQIGIASNDDQFCQIATFLGKDARQAPPSDPTIAGLVIAEIEQLRTRLACVVQNCQHLDDTSPSAVALCMDYGVDPFKDCSKEAGTNE